MLGIETSCDETAISIIETEGKIGLNFGIKILANEVLSQIALHRQYGGVFPSLAKREHSKNLIPLLKKALEKADILEFEEKNDSPKNQKDWLQNINIDEKREPEMWKLFFEEIPKIKKPEIDAIAVTKGPGLEPALWTGINLAKALSAFWNIPLVPVNHMEGHIFASLLRRKGIFNFQFSIFKKITTGRYTTRYQLSAISFPAIALLISGGHTELILIKNWFEYEIIGATRDDAVGEAFDKVARILGLPYPGGPEISRIAKEARKSPERNFELPRPMLNSGDFDFSFSGLKTAVLYMVKKLPELTDKIKSEIAKEFEDAAVETLVKKAMKAAEKYNVQTLIVGGGVAANQHLRNNLEKETKRQNIDLLISEINHSTDNALMIALAGAARFSLNQNTEKKNIVAEGNFQIDKIN